MLKLVSFKKNDKDDMLQALSNLSDFDCDFIGENGADYLWDNARLCGFSCNQDYALDLVKDLSYEEAIKTFLDIWMRHDAYYHNYEYETICNKNIVSLAVAIECGY